MTCLPILVAGFADRLAWLSVPYWVLWCGSFVLSMGLLVLLRARWTRWRPLQKCAVLSLLVHLLLACVAMTIRVVVGDGQGGIGPPIRVRIVHDSGEDSLAATAASELETDMAAPQLLEPPAPEPEQASAQDAAPPADAAPLTEAASPEPVEVAVDPATQPPLELEPTNNLAAVPNERASEPSPEDQATDATPAAENNSPDASQHAAASPAPASPPPAPAAPYSMRSSPGRLGLIQLQGGDARTEAAVAAALGWLATAQSADGRWDANRFGAGQEHLVLNHDRGGAGRNADTGVSALAVLAFLGAGHTHVEGDHQQTVRRGLEFLIASQASDGSLFGNATFYAQMYCHSMATFALAEALAMTGDRRLEPAVAKALGYCLSAQHPATGGWRYQPGDAGDTSQLGWQMMALASAERAGLEVPSHTWVRVGRFLRSVRRGHHEGLASYRPDGPPSTSMTAEAMYCRLLLEATAGERLPDAASSEATAQLLRALPSAERINLYYWYYATLALHHRHEADQRAAAAWQTWNEALKAALLHTQVADGPDTGSWNTNTLWGGYGGRVYTTAMAAMCLEVYYRYAPAAPPGRWTATRPDAVEPPR